MVVKFDVQHPSSLARVTVHAPSFVRRAAIASVFVVLYALSIQWCYETAGEPLAAALKELAEKEALWNETGGEVRGNTTEDLLEQLAEIEAEPHHSVADSNSTISPKPLPSWYLPNAWAGALLFTIGTLNVLFFFLGQWMVWFKAESLFSPAASVTENSFVQVHTHAHRGEGALCKLHRCALPPHRLCFEFQRQRYEYIPPSEVEAERKKDKDVIGIGEHNGYVRLMKCPVDLPVSTYYSSHGLEDKDIKAGVAYFGQNTLVVPTPKFLALYRQQMTSPLVVFQFFTAILWMLDEYWQYVVMQMVMILVLESTTVFQRIKTFGTLNSMSSKPYKIMVFRNRKWQEQSTLDLLPGDLISVKPAAKPASAIVPNGATAPKPAAPALEENTGIIPCDCLLLQGDAVVNEATLTGESVPQMKDALPVVKGQEQTPLDIDGAHRVHMLFSGTSIIACHSAEKDAKSKGGVTDPKCSPDGGCVCYVIRTGFNSSQGNMMQMIEFSQHKMTDDSKETGYALLVLLVFALIAAGYVLKKGLEKGDRTTHELLIKCVIIITSTVPKQLPMQMAMAVNTALMGLMKNGVFCTEPFRVPIAGKVNRCVFDKTGTLTTDQLVPVGMMNPSGPKTGSLKDRRGSLLHVGDKVTVDGVKSKPELNGEVVVVKSVKDGRVEVERKSGDRLSLKRSDLLAAASGTGANSADPPHGLFPMAEACPEALMVVAGCHSLVEVEGFGLMGDPIELSALKAMEWRYESKSATAFPGNWETTEKAIENLLSQIQKIPEGDTERRKTAEKQLADARERVSEAKARAKKSSLKSVKILHRHHFSSKLQRMSVVADVHRDASPKGQVCLVKGSPESIKSLLVEGSAPEWYERTYREMAEHGLRILALAYKWAEKSDAKGTEAPSREWVESDLQFGGFLAFCCKSRADSGIVLRSIQDASIGVAMLTGDGPLTALHVAREVSICSSDDSIRPCYLLDVAPDNTVQWVRAVGEERDAQPFKSPGVVELSKTHDLMVTESALEAAAEQSRGEIWKEVVSIQIFARMSPHGKATVIRAMQKHNGACVFMCGDGGNDVGALKQADVGIALLSGYGNTNTSDEVKTKSLEVEGGKELSAEEELNSQQAVLAKRQKASQKLMKEEMKAVHAELQAKQKKRMTDELKARQDRGEDAGFGATMSIMKSTMSEFRTDLIARQKEIAAKYGNVYDKDKASNLLKEELEAEMACTIVRPGDASVAAAFTSRAPSIRNVVDVVRQGRCTLLSALQNQQIMMLECIISAYTISALSLEGGRSSERQMMASSWLLMIGSIAFAFATPIDRMSKTQPINSLFHPAVFFSMLGQAAIHLACLVYAVHLATDAMGPVALKEVVDFHKTQKMIRLGQLCKDGSAPANSTSGCPPDPEIGEDLMAWAMSMINTPFLPNLLNSVIWLVETSQMCAVTFVNYKGRPWMKGLMENHPLFLSSFGCILMVGVCAWELMPQLNSLIHLAPFPDDEFRIKVMILVCMSLGGTFIWDRLCVAIFAPEVMAAYVENARLTTVEDIMSVLYSLGKVAGCLCVYLTGNPLIWFGAFWYYRKVKAQQEARDA